MIRAKHLLLSLLSIYALPSVAQPGTGVIRVATTGTDSGTCGAVATPCRNPQQAVHLAVTGEEVRVAAGTYVYAPAVTNFCTQFLASEAVICVLNKDVRVNGGFSTANWTTADPVNNVTILDGQSTRRVVLLQRTGSGEPSAGLTLTGLTVRNGRTQGATSGGDAATFAFGGGLIADFARLEVRKVTFSSNVAQGGTVSSGYGGSGAGGAVALRATTVPAYFEDVTFQLNEARGGDGPQRGGLAVGGGLYTYDADLTAVRTTFTDNQALSGNSAGSGVDGVGLHADAQGGGAAFQVGSSVVLRGVTASANRAVGGNAGTAAGATGGGAFGGALYGEGWIAASLPTSIEVWDADLRGNLALGGAARNGGLGAGGAFMTSEVTVALHRSILAANESTGGPANGGVAGAAGGGGGYFTRATGTDTLNLTHTVVAGNLVDGFAGGGGGLFLQGVQGTLDHLTLDDNRNLSASMQGLAMVLLSGAQGANVQLRWSAVSGHDSVAQSAIHVQSGNTISFSAGLFAGNADDTNQGAPGAGTFNNPGAMSGVSDLLYTSPGSPTFDYHLLDNSPALGAATGSTANLDLDGQRRDGNRDVGADEHYPGLIFANGFEQGDLGAWQ